MGIFSEIRSWYLAAVSGMPGAVGYRLRARNWRNSATRKNSSISIEPGTHVADFNRLQFAGDLSVGQTCAFDNSAGDIILGERVAFNRNVILGADFGRIEIGDDTVVGPNVVMRAADHRIDLESDEPIRNLGHVQGEIRIGRGAWIGANAVILSGATVGDGAVIGAGAVVRGQVPSHSVAVGVPARVIRQRSKG